jgi:hypothetical protein
LVATDLAKDNLVATIYDKQNLPTFFELLELAYKKATANKKAFEAKREGRGETNKQGAARWAKMEQLITDIKTAL